MRILHVRFIVLLSLVYLCLVCLLYSYLWNTYSLERGWSFLQFTHKPVPHDRDVFEFSGDTVEFNFKRRNGLLQDTNGSATSFGNISTKLTAREPCPSTESSLAYNTSCLYNRTLFDVSRLPPPSYCIHAFYYMWYGNSEHDGKYYHWNHQYLPHWQKAVSKRFPQGRHVPPHDIGASFYPELGCYSSKDPKILQAHMYQLRKAGIGVVSVSWYPKGLADDEGFPPDPLIPILLDIALMYSIKVTIHIEPYKGRSPASVRENLMYIMKSYSDHPAFYKHEHITDARGTRKLVPLIYVYDSYLSLSRDWAKILKPDGSSSIRGTEVDCIVISLLVEKAHQKFIIDGGFDGFYTYFASQGFSFGSNTKHWDQLADFARKNNLIFIPSFGPGYDDTQVRPWNKENKRSRLNGKYYREMFQEAVRTRVGARNLSIISLTSFNEWHEGTQIESAIPKKIDSFTYEDYEPRPPDYYLQLTREISTHLQCT